MCIRDSVRGGVKAVPVITPRTTGAGGVELRMDSPPGTLVPVSYTHLRAHETVLDIVCRLLLEKKNT